MRSMITGWWSWLVVFWTAAVFGLAVVSLFEDDGTLAGSLFMAAIGGATAAGFVLRKTHPRLGAGLLVASVGFLGAGFFWALLIPTALALIIIVGGLAKGEITFSRPTTPLPH